MKPGGMPFTEPCRGHFRKLKQEMEEASVEPGFDVNKIGATFNRQKNC